MEVVEGRNRDCRVLCNIIVDVEKFDYNNRISSYFLSTLFLTHCPFSVNSYILPVFASGFMHRTRPLSLNAIRILDTFDNDIFASFLISAGIVGFSRAWTTFRLWFPLITQLNNSQSFPIPAIRRITGQSIICLIIKLRSIKGQIYKTIY